MRPSGGWGIDGIKKENTTAYLFYPVCSLGNDWCSGDSGSCIVAVFRRDRDRMDPSGKLYGRNAYRTCQTDSVSRAGDGRSHSGDMLVWSV